MKFTCNREKLLETIQIAESITPKKTSKPILKNVKLDAFDNKIRITATNIELTMKKTLDVGSVGEEGSILVLGKDIAEILRTTKAEEIFISVEDNTVILKAGRNTHTFQTNITEDFFSIEDIKTDFEIEINKDRLALMINQTIFTAGKETMAYTFEGVLFNIEKSNLELVGTDGKRIAIASGESSNKSNKEQRSLVPVLTLRSLANILNISTDDTITIGISDNHIVFKDSTTELISRLIEGRFPEYRNYLPKEFGVTAVFNKEKLIEGIKEAGIFASQETHLITFLFQKDDMVMTMKSRSLDRGESNISVSMEKYEGDDLTIGFNGWHIIDVLRVIEEESVALKIKDDQGPGEVEEKGNFRYVFMPVKIK